MMGVYADIIGASFAWVQVIIDYFVSGKGLGFRKELNYGKFCLNFLCMTCCFVFIYQYLIYGSNKPEIVAQQNVENIIEKAKKVEQDPKAHEDLESIRYSCREVLSNVNAMNSEKRMRRASTLHGGGVTSPAISHKNLTLLRKVTDNVSKGKLKDARKLLQFDLIIDEQ